MVLFWLMSKKILLSGVKPTGAPHIGNYLGAMRQFMELQNDYECLFMIADYHALNTVQDAKEMKKLILGVTMDFLATGLDPRKVTIFQQSAISAHTELAWIFNTITTMPFLMRAHAFKDAEAKNKEISVGTFDYPMLMAADILLYGTDLVPVGRDQKQHVEIARDTAAKFNRIFGETFKLPEPRIPEEVGTIPGVDGQKMSKSYNNTIPLFAEDDEIQKAVMSIVTDSKTPEEPKNPDEDNIFALHKHFSVEDLADIRRRYEEGGMGYKESKDILAENIKKFIAPLREKRKELEKDPEYVLNVLKEGQDRARILANDKMEDVRNKIGIKI